MGVRFVDLKEQYKYISDDISRAMARVIESADFILGQDLTSFEEEFAHYCGTNAAVGLDSGVSALELALRAAEIGPGDEVITVSNTFIATVSAISFTGAKPVFVDVDPTTYNIDVRQLGSAITQKTKAIIPVHLYGQPADMDPIKEVASRHGLLVVEDACQAHGAAYKNRRVGGIGDVGCFSFYPGKNLGAYGDGGILVTNDTALAEKVRMLRNYGQREKYQHAFLAYNRRLDTLQAAILRVKLSHLDEWNRKRRSIAERYCALLSNVKDVVLPTASPDREHVYHLYVIQAKDRNRLKTDLTKKGIMTGVHYPTPVHLQPCYKNLGVKVGSLPVTEAVSQRVLSLPMYPELEDTQIKYVCDAIAEYE